MAILSIYLVIHTPNFRDRPLHTIANILPTISCSSGMNASMKHVLSSLQRARLHLDDTESRLDVHSVVHDLMQDLIEAGGLPKRWDPAAIRLKESRDQDWLYELIEGLTETCFKLAEAPPNEAALALRLRLDRAIDGCRPYAIWAEAGQSGGQHPA